MKKELESLHGSVTGASNIITRIIRSLHQQDYEMGNHYLKMLFPVLDNAVSEIIKRQEFKEDINKINSMLEMLFDLFRAREWTGLSNLLEGNLQPYLIELHMYLVEKENLETYSRFDEFIKTCYRYNSALAKMIEENRKKENSYQQKFTPVGNIIINKSGSENYINSQINPFEEAMIKAEEYYNPEIDEYVILGCELGPLPVRLFEIDKSIQVKIYEPSMEKLVVLYQARSDIETEKRTIIYDPDYNGILKEIENYDRKSKVIIIHHACIEEIEDIQKKNKIQSFFEQECNLRYKNRYLELNFYKDIYLNNPFLEEEKITDTLVIVNKILVNSIYEYRRQNFRDGNEGMKFVLEFCRKFQKQNFYNQYVNQNENEALETILESIYKAYESRQYVFLADCLEDKLQTFFIQTQFKILHNNDSHVYSYMENNKKLYNQNFLKNVANTDNGYSLEYALTGAKILIMETKKQKIYFHSNIDPCSEGRLLAENYYDPEVKEYVIYGVGQGYHVTALADKIKDAKISVYESELDILKLLFMYQDLEYWKFKNIDIIYDPDFRSLRNKFHEIESGKGILMIHYPSMNHISNVKIKEALENYFVFYSSLKNQGDLLKRNFLRNTGKKMRYVDELESNFKDKKVFIIAAGPSLDKNVELLKSKNEDSIILACGTVFKKLIDLGINIDYVIVSDPADRVVAQIRGLEKEKIPMLLLSTANYEFAEKYEGDKYLIYQNEYEPAEKAAEEYNFRLYNTGGSVITTALDVAALLGAKQIIFLGLDLAYIENYSHAAGASQREIASTMGLRPIVTIDGKNAYTSRVFDSYRRWIEERIKKLKDIEFIDATEGGAKISGMKIGNLIDYI